MNRPTVHGAAAKEGQDIRAAGILVRLAIRQHLGDLVVPKFIVSVNQAQAPEMRFDKAPLRCGNTGRLPQGKCRADALENGVLVQRHMQELGVGQCIC